MTYFTEDQRFTQPWLWALLLGVTGLFSYGAYRGVELRFRSGERLLIGSQDPDRLAGALERARSDRSAARPPLRPPHVTAMIPYAT